MTATELVALIGKRARWRARNLLLVEVEILDARQTFNRIDVLVRPVAGEGEEWCSLDTVTVMD